VLAKIPPNPNGWKVAEVGNFLNAINLGEFVDEFSDLFLLVSLIIFFLFDFLEMNSIDMSIIFISRIFFF